MPEMWTTHLESPLGAMVAVGGPAGLAALAYEDENVEVLLRRAAATLGPAAADAGRLDGVRRELDEYFNRHRQTFSITLDFSLISGAFARRALADVATVPFGTVTSYGAVAAAAGSPRAARAVGNAVAANPLPIVVPCHRVLAAVGIGGYTGGLHRKRFLLDLEGIPH